MISEREVCIFAYLSYESKPLTTIASKQWFTHDLHTRGVVVANVIKGLVHHL